MLTSLYTAVASVLFNVLQLLLNLTCLRLLCEKCNVDYFNPINQFIVKTTDVIFSPFDKIKRTMSISQKAIFFAIIIQFATILISFSCEQGFNVNGIFALSVMIFANILSTLVKIVFWFIIIEVVASWLLLFGIGDNIIYSPAFRFINHINYPFLSVIRKSLPTFGGLDFAPLALLFIMQLILAFLGNLLVGIQ